MVPGLLAAALALCTIHPLPLDSELGRRSIPWLPPDLARQVVRHERDFNRGAAAAAAWPAALHRPSHSRQGLQTAIHLQCERLVKALHDREPFSEVVAGLGSLAHLVLDLGSPFASMSSAGSHVPAFGTYMETAEPRIPQVFYGQWHQMIVGGTQGVDRLVAWRLAQNASLGPIVVADMDKVGGPAAWRRLDDRSSSFGAASLVLNHAVSDFANLASWVWYHGGGLVPEISSAPGTLLVWRGEPQPREAPRTRLGFRQSGP